MSLAGSYKIEQNCEFIFYFTPLMMMIIALEFTVVSGTTFICYILIFFKIVKEKAKRKQLGKL